MILHTNTANCCAYHLNGINVKFKVIIFRGGKQARLDLCACIRGVTERCEQTLGTASTYQDKKNIHINACPETFNLLVIAERVHL
jgi:hypothetical protein